MGRVGSGAAVEAGGAVPSDGKEYRTRHEDFDKGNKIILIITLTLAFCVAMIMTERHSERRAMHSALHRPLSHIHFSRVACLL